VLIFGFAIWANAIPYTGYEMGMRVAAGRHTSLVRYKKWEGYDRVWNGYDHTLIPGIYPGMKWGDSSYPVFAEHYTGDEFSKFISF
jgi:hypothetical protein